MLTPTALADTQVVYRGGIWYVSRARYAELTSGDQERMEVSLHEPVHAYDMSHSECHLDRLANGGGL